MFNGTGSESIVSNREYRLQDKGSGKQEALIDNAAIGQFKNPKEQI